MLSKEKIFCEHNKYMYFIHFPIGLETILDQILFGADSLRKLVMNIFVRTGLLESGAISLFPAPNLVINGRQIS